MLSSRMPLFHFAGRCSSNRGVVFPVGGVRGCRTEAREGTRSDKAGQLGVSVHGRTDGRCGRRIRVERDDQWSALL